MFKIDREREHGPLHPRIATLAATPAGLRHLRSLLRRRSLRAYAYWLRYLNFGLTRRTQGQPEPHVADPERRYGRVTVRRPANRGPAAPTAATVHAVRARCCANRI